MGLLGRELLRYNTIFQNLLWTVSRLRDMIRILREWSCPVANVIFPLIFNSMLSSTGTENNREKTFERDGKNESHFFLQTQTKSEIMSNVLAKLSRLVKEISGLEEDTFVEIR